MARVKYQSHPAQQDGWTERLWPVPAYRFACCDCGLVHDLKLEAFAITPDRAGTFVVGRKISRSKARVGMKVRRNNRATGQLRRYHQFP